MARGPLAASPLTAPFRPTPLADPHIPVELCAAERPPHPVPGGMQEWTKAALGNHKPEMFNSDQGFPFETLARLDPDVFLATSTWPLIAESWDKLNAIAPVVGHVDGPVDRVLRPVHRPRPVRGRDARDPHAVSAFPVRRTDAGPHPDLAGDMDGHRDRSGGRAQADVQLGGADGGGTAGPQPGSREHPERVLVELDLLADTADGHRPGTDLGQRHQAGQVGCAARPRDRIAVRARGRVPQQVGEALLHVVGDDVLPARRLPVGLLPLEAEDVDEQHFSQPVAADDALGDLLTGGGEPEPTIVTVDEEATGPEALDPFGGSRGRDAQPLTDPGADGGHAVLGQLEERGQVFLIARPGKKVHRTVQLRAPS